MQSYSMVMVLGVIAFINPCYNFPFLNFPLLNNNRRDGKEKKKMTTYQIFLSCAYLLFLTIWIVSLICFVLVVTRRFGYPSIEKQFRRMYFLFALTITSGVASIIIYFMISLESLR
jgi:hypothetical protein